MVLSALIFSIFIKFIYLTGILEETLIEWLYTLLFIIKILTIAVIIFEKKYLKVSFKSFFLYLKTSFIFHSTKSKTNYFISTILKRFLKIKNCLFCYNVQNKKQKYFFDIIFTYIIY